MFRLSAAPGEAFFLQKRIFLQNLCENSAQMYENCPVFLWIWVFFHATITIENQLNTVLILWLCRGTKNELGFQVRLERIQEKLNERRLT